MRISLFITSCYLLSLTLFSDSESMFMVEIKATNIEQRSKIAELIHPDSINNDRIYSVINKNDLQILLSDPNVDVISSQILNQGESVDKYFHPFLMPLDFPSRDSAFHNFDEMKEALDNLVESHPHIVSLFSLGKSIENRDVWGIRLSIDEGLTTQELNNKKAVFFMGTHHAREHVSTEVPIMFAEYLIDHVDTQADIQALLKKIEIFIVPMVNPDGALHDISGNNYKYWRKNRRNNGDGSYGVDLNRNYGWGWGTGGSSSHPSSDIYMGTAPFSEPETKIVRDFFIAHRNITIAVSFHTFSELVLYPWGGQDGTVGGDDEKIFKKMAKEMAAMNHYTPMQSSDLYIASGDTCDWAYGELGVYCFTFELSPDSIFGGGFYPGAGVINSVFQDNLAPMLYLSNLTDNPHRVIQ